MGRSSLKRGSVEAQQLEAVRRVRDLEERNAQVRREILRGQLIRAIAQFGEAAYALWHAERPRLVALGLMAADVVITPSAWTPLPAPAPHQAPLPPTPTAVEAARIAAELLAERPAMTREDHVALEVFIARLRALHQELGWMQERPGLAGGALMRPASEPLPRVVALQPQSPENLRCLA